jgi:hypothetical protein
MQDAGCIPHGRVFRVVRQKFRLIIHGRIAVLPYCPIALLRLGYLEPDTRYLI